MLALPSVVTVAVPLWIGRRYGVAMARPTSAAGVAAMLAGAAVIGLGLFQFGAWLHNFFAHGRGTLAPWDPPRRLVVRGPYRYVRNPMISGIVFVLAGTALLLRSRPHAAWAATFLVMNAIYIPLSEEPMLAERFGEDYREYCRHVRRFLPRRRAWRGAEDRRQKAEGRRQEAEMRPKW